jgi:hypothetical protein
MAYPDFWDSIARDLTGPGMFGGKFQIRLIIQPLAAMLLGVRIGLRDAKLRRIPFFEALFRGKGERAALLAKAIRDAIIPLAIAVLVDSILQHNDQRAHPCGRGVRGGRAVCLPFLIVRGVSNRIWTHGHRGPGHPVPR